MADDAPVSELAARLREEVVFVLVGPQHPGNVGAAARAMANMGLRRLVVVDPAPSFDPERMRWMAPRTEVVLDRLRIVGTLDEALHGVHRAIATTARHRADGQRVHTPDALARDLLDDAPGRVTAILFGREDTGLTRAETSRCESLLRIPTDRHASLNLGQAVLLVAHGLFEEARDRGLRAGGRIIQTRDARQDTLAHSAPGPRDAAADVTSLEPALDELLQLLGRVGYLRGTEPAKVGVSLREALQRARLSYRHVDALRGMVGRVQFALDHPEIPWRATTRQKRRLAQAASREAEE